MSPARPRALRKPRHPVTLNGATAALRSGTNSKEMLGSREFAGAPFCFPVEDAWQAISRWPTGSS